MEIGRRSDSPQSGNLENGLLLSCIFERKYDTITRKVCSFFSKLMEEENRMGARRKIALLTMEFSGTYPQRVLEGVFSQCEKLSD